MHANLAPGERLRPDTFAALEALFAQPDVEAVLLPLSPEGEGALARAARSYLSRWDRRFVHRMNFFAPASRVVTRAPLDGWRNAEAAPHLARAIEEGRRVEALPEHGALTPIARDLDAWVRHFHEQGLAWGRLAAREPSYRGFLPALTWGGWTRHNVRQAPRRVVELLEAVRATAPLALALHHAREAAFTGGCVRGAAR